MKMTIIKFETHTHTHTHIYVYMYVIACSDRIRNVIY